MLQGGNFLDALLQDKMSKQTAQLNQPQDLHTTHIPQWPAVYGPESKVPQNLGRTGQIQAHLLDSGEESVEHGLEDRILDISGKYKLPPPSAPEWEPK